MFSETLENARKGDDLEGDFLVLKGREGVVCGGSVTPSISTVHLHCPTDHHTQTLDNKNLLLIEKRTLYIYCLKDDAFDSLNTTLSMGVSLVEERNLLC